VQEQIKKGATAGEAGASKDALINLIAKVTGTGAGDIREESRLVDDLGLTSIGRLELVNYLEQEYRLDIEDSQVGPQSKVSDLRQIIAKREKFASHDHYRFWTNSALIRGLRKLSDALFLYPLFRSFVTPEVRGAERLDQLDGPVVFVANHLSYFDQPSLMFALPKRIRYRTATAAWEEFFFGEYHGLDLLWRRTSYQLGTLLLNLFPLPQTRGFSGALKFMGKLTDRGINTLIFPEGEHSKDGKMHEFQPGLGIIVKELGIPVVPIKIEGTQKVLAPGASFPKRGRVTVTFGEPLYFRFEEANEIVEKTHRAVEEL
jgi:long-chain acyl-CoA synthetase